MLSLIDILLSSAVNILYYINKTRLFMIRFSSRGPSIDPCGIHATTVSSLMHLQGSEDVIYYKDS